MGVGLHTSLAATVHAVELSLNGPKGHTVIPEKKIKVGCIAVPAGKLVCKTLG